MTLEDIYRPLRGDLELVERRLREVVRNEEADVTETIERLLSAGGKRLRPALLLLSARGCNYTGDRAVSMAAAVELVHTASLIHDDVIDGAEVRRGVATVNSSWDNKRSVLLGDYIYTMVVDMVAADGDLDIIRVLASTAAAMARGEMTQTLCRNELNVEEREYLDIVGRKTASLLSCCCRVGALLGPQRNGEAEALGRYGFNLGMAFQITDDVLDITGNDSELGKTVGNDLREGRLTLPFIRAMNEAGESDRDWLRGAFRSGDVDGEVLGRARDLVDRFEGIAYSRDVALEYARACKTHLDALEESESRTALAEIADYVVSRAS
jgi:octaprenyl-diphosphate synthase